MKIYMQLLTAARVKLAHLPKADRCSDTCPGWGVFATDGEALGGFQIQRCDDCWACLKVDDQLFDEEAALLPAAQAELRQTVQRVHDEEHGTCYGMFAEWCPHCLAKLSWLKCST